MSAPFDFVLLIIMVGYGFLSGAGAYFLKVGLSKATNLELTLKGLFRNPIGGLFRLLKIPTFLLGGVLSVSGFLIYQFSLLNYDVTVVKPLTNLNLIFIFVFGFYLLKEQISKRETLGIIAMIAGVILVSMYAEDTSTAPNLTNMIIFSVLAVIICIVFILFTFLKGNKKINEYFLSIASGVIFSLGVLFNKAIYETGFSFDIQSYLYNPYTYLLLLAYFIAIFIEFVAFSSGRLVVIGPIVNLIGVGVPIIGALFIFNETLIILFAGAMIFPLSFVKLFGIILIIIGTLAIYPKITGIKKKEPVE